MSFFLVFFFHEVVPINKHKVRYSLKRMSNFFFFFLDGYQILVFHVQTRTASVFIRIIPILEKKNYLPLLFLLFFFLHFISHISIFLKENLIMKTQDVNTNEVYYVYILILTTLFFSLRFSGGSAFIKGENWERDRSGCIR